MNWVAFGLLLWVSAGLEQGLSGALEVGPWGVGPRFVLVLVAFVGLFASRWHALWAGLIAGVVLDLMHVVGVSGQERSVVVIGPHALGCLLGVYAVVTARSMVFRDRVSTLAMVSFGVTLLVGVSSSFLLVMRTAYDVIELVSPGRMLVVWLGSAVYTGVAAFPLALIFAVVRPLMGFQGRVGSGVRLR